MPYPTPHLELLPAILKVVDLAADGVLGKVALLHHVVARDAHVLDSRLVAGNLRLQGLVLLHQVLNTNQVTPCNTEED